MQTKRKIKIHMARDMKTWNSGCENFADREEIKELTAKYVH